MVLHSGEYDDARHCHVQDRGIDRRQTSAHLRTRRVRNLLSACVAALLSAASAHATDLRVAFWEIELSRSGPGVLLRDIKKGDDPQIAAAVRILDDIAPDVLVLGGFDTDAAGVTLDAFADQLSAIYPHRFTQIGNEGRDSGADLNGNGRLGEPEDAFGYGEFTGDGGLAVLAQAPWPLSLQADLTRLLWADLPGAEIADDTLPPGVAQVQRLSSTSHWILSAGPLTLLIHSATPPIFDGPEDRNGRRNHDEAALWLRVLDDGFAASVAPPFVLMAKVNADPVDGDGRASAVVALLQHPAIQDPQPSSDGAQQEATPGHEGDPSLDTANWTEPEPGNLRASYILPSQDLVIRDAGVVWPGPETDAAMVSRHGLVWVDVSLPAP